MTDGSPLPKFGNWESEENVQYTKFFEKARKGRNNGKMLNPNDPEWRLNDAASPHSITRTEQVKLTGQRDFDENQRPAASQSAGSNMNGTDHSPLHPHFQGRPMGKVGGFSSPSLERKGLNGNGRGTPERSQLKPVMQSNNSLVEGAAVPKFGDWENGYDYTLIFNQMREEKQAGGAEYRGTNYERPTINSGRASGGGRVMCCCFPWWRK